MHNLSEGVHNNNLEFEEHGVASLLPKSMNSRITKMLEKSSQRRIIIRSKVYAKEVITRYR